MVVDVVFIKDHKTISYIRWNNRMNNIIALTAGLDPMIKNLVISKKMFQ